MRLISLTFQDGSTIPKPHAEDGNNLSPPLRWEGVPDAAAELALVVEDPDAPQENPFVHWLVYKIPADAQAIPAGVPHDEQLVNPNGALQGLNDFKQNSLGYRGPAPPKGHGLHHYRFQLYALDEPLTLGPGITRGALLEAMKGHIVDQAELVGTYERT